MIDGAVVSSIDPGMMVRLRGMMAKTRNRARRDDIAHDLSGGCITRLFHSQQGRCAVSGLPFSMKQFAGVLVKYPFAPSLDRISSQSGYTDDNVRLVCVAVNFGMGQWGEELYMTFARASVERDEAALSLHQTWIEPDQNADDPSVREADDPVWAAAQLERLAAAETIASILSGESRIRQERQIASRKRVLTMGQGGLQAAGIKAAETRRRRRLGL